MGNAAYEARRAAETERMLAQERAAAARAKQEAMSEEVAALLMAALKDFLEGGACLTIEDGPDGIRLIRFRRG